MNAAPPRPLTKESAGLGRSGFDEIVHLISHDLQAPVRALCTIPEWIEDDLSGAKADLPPEIFDNINLMKTQGNRLRKMISDLLTYAQVAFPQPVFDGDWGQLMNRVKANVPDANEIEVKLKGPFRIGAVDLETLLTALVSNAVKHGQSPTGKFRISATFCENQGTLAVQDEGSGIAEKDRERAKAPFVTLQSRDLVEGSGMGLAIAEKICGHYGGELALLEGPAGGCLAMATIPVTKGAT